MPVIDELSSLHSPALAIAGPSIATTSSPPRPGRRYLLSAFAVRAPNTILLYHCSLTVAALQGLRALGVVQLEPLRWRLAAAWFPANLLFVGMIVTSFYALQVGRRLAVFITVFTTACRQRGQRCCVYFQCRHGC